jgi:putative flippase GtrA
LTDFIKTIESRSRRVPLFFRQAVKFGMVGVLNTAIDLGLFFALTHWVAFFGSASGAAKAISYSAGILNSFFWNRNWTFRSSSNSWATMLPFIVVNLAALAINYGLYQLGLHYFHFSTTGALILATGGTLALNFIASKFVVFRK